MATDIILVTFFATLLISNSLAVDTPACEDVCSNTYPPQAVPKGEEHCSCMRGCRLFAVIDLLEGTDENSTRNSCIFSCESAYADDDNKKACILGCNSKQPFLPKMPDIDVDLFQPMDMDMSLMSPMLYVHDFYSNMINKFSSSFSSSWTFYMQMNNGKMVVIRSGPIIMYQGDEGVNTMNYYETNLPGKDGSETPDQKDTQLTRDGWSMLARDPQEQQIDMQISTSPSSKWFNCFSQRSSTSQVLLMIAVFLSLLGFMWLAVTALMASSQKKYNIDPQKLSIYGDMEYLTKLDHKLLLSASTPQQFVEAPPLPLKLQVNSV